MKFARIGSLSAATFVLTMITMAAEPAIAADPLQPTAGAWVTMDSDAGSKWWTGGDTAPGVSSYPQSSIDGIQFKLVTVGNGPTSALTQVTIQRPRGQFDKPFGIPMGKAMSSTVITLRKPAINGQADWYRASLQDAKVVADEVRRKEGASTSTEIVILSFSKAYVSHRVQTAQGYGEYASVPPQFDVIDNVALVPNSGPGTPPGPARPTPPSGMRQ